jgi:hypothetical protein
MMMLLELGISHPLCAVAQFGASIAQSGLKTAWRRVIAAPRVLTIANVTAEKSGALAMNLVPA